MKEPSLGALWKGPGRGETLAFLEFAPKLAYIWEREVKDSISLAPSFSLWTCSSFSPHSPLHSSRTSDVTLSLHFAFFHCSHQSH